MKKILLQSLAMFTVFILVLWLQKKYETAQNNDTVEAAKKEIIFELRSNFVGFKSFHENLSDYDVMLDSIAGDGLLNRKKNIDIKHYRQLFRSLFHRIYSCQCRQFTFKNIAYAAAQKNGSLAYFDFDLIQDLERIYAYQNDNCNVRNELLDMLEHQIELIETHNYLNFSDLNWKLSKMYLRGYHTYRIDMEYDIIFNALGTSFEDLDLVRFLEKPVSQ